MDPTVVLLTGEAILVEFVSVCFWKLDFQKQSRECVNSFIPPCMWWIWRSLLSNNKNKIALYLHFLCFVFLLQILLLIVVFKMNGFYWLLAHTPNEWLLQLHNCSKQNLNPAIKRRHHQIHSKWSLQQGLEVLKTSWNKFDNMLTMRLPMMRKRLNLSKVPLHVDNIWVNDGRMLMMMTIIMIKKKVTRMKMKRRL